MVTPLGHVLPFELSVQMGRGVIAVYCEGHSTALLVRAPWAPWAHGPMYSWAHGPMVDPS